MLRHALIIIETNKTFELHHFGCCYTARREFNNEKNNASYKFHSEYAKEVYDCTAAEWFM